MTSDVLAVVLAHDESDYLNHTLEALSQQTLPPSRILIVDTSRNFPVNSADYEVLTLPPKTNFATAINAAVRHAQPTGYLWLLHDDSAPEKDALQKLMHEVELSPSLAVVGPKQVDWENPRVIKQLGLTLTRAGRIFNRVSGDYDQGQHDYIQDVMAVGSAGALYNLETFMAIGGFDKNAPAAAVDLDYCMRARLTGARVAVAPEARVRHATLTQEGIRSWGLLSPRAATRWAELHLSLSYASVFLLPLIWIALVPGALLNSLGLLLRKRVSDIPSELLGAIAGFIGIFGALGSRSKISKTAKLSVSTLKSLRATPAELKQANQRHKDAEISRAMIEAHSRGEHVVIVSERDGIKPIALWWALALVALNFAWFPSQVAITGSGVIPLGLSWLDVFDQAGSYNHALGLGFFGPSDPWVWALAIISAPTFFEPSLAITIWTYLATAIAFLGAFVLAAQVSKSNVVRVIAGLGIALWPTITFSLSQVSFAQLLAQSLLPWLLVSLAKIAALGRLNSLRTAMPWSQLGIAALLFAIVSSASPITGVAVAVIVIVLAGLRAKRAVPLLFSLGLGAAWWLPLLAQARSLSDWLSLLMPPGLGDPYTLTTDWSLIFMGYRFDSLRLDLLIAAVAVVVALFAFFAPRLSFAILLSSFAAIAAAIAWVGSGISFTFENQTPLDISGPLTLVGLFLMLLYAHASEGVAAVRISASLLVAVLGIVPAAYQVATNPPTVSFSDGRVVPSIVQAEATAGSGLRTIKLTTRADGAIALEVFEGNGVQLHELSTRFELALPNLQQTIPDYQELGQLVANLRAANGEKLSDSFAALKIGFVLVSPEDEALKLALDSNSELESVGTTDFGQLWKVRNIAKVPSSEVIDFDLIKLGQLGALALFGLLSIPSGLSRRRRGQDSTIFIDQEESN